MMGLEWVDAAPLGGMELPAPGPAMPPRGDAVWAEQLDLVREASQPADPERVRQWFQSPIEPTNVQPAIVAALAQWQQAYFRLDLPQDPRRAAAYAVQFNVGLYHALLSAYQQQYTHNLNRPLESVAIHHPDWESSVGLYVLSPSPGFPDEVGVVSGTAAQVFAQWKVWDDEVHAPLLADLRDGLIQSASVWPLAFDEGYAWGQVVADATIAHQSTLHAQIVPRPVVTD